MTRIQKDRKVLLVGEKDCFRFAKSKPRGVASVNLQQVGDLRSVPTEGEPYGFQSLSPCQK